MNVPPTSAARLAEALPFGNGDAVFVLHGPGTTDVYCCNDLIVRNIDHALLGLLRSAGFRRVAFCNPSELYYLDRNSADNGTDRATGTSTGSLRFFSGPRGGIDHLSDQAPPQRTPRQSLQDPFKVQQLQAMMTNRRVRTAVVMHRAEDLFAYNEAPRELADRIGGWIESGTATGNLAVLLFNHASLDRIIELIERRNMQGTLLAFLEEQRNRTAARSIGTIQPPDSAEIGRLVHHARLTSGLRVADWTTLPNMLAAMAAQNLPTRTWHQRLAQLGGVEPLSVDSLRRRAWVKSVTTDGRSALERLDDLVGIEPVKDHIRQLAMVVRSEQARNLAARHREDTPSYNMVFSGNPGTGKTTVARLIGEIFRELGLLRRGHVHEVRLSDLVAGYVGQTAARTNAAVDQALEGVLFIDEAYSLIEPGRGGFGAEAVDSLLVRLENDRHRLITIAAGYPVKMRAFRESANPGIRRRFPYVIDFPDMEPGQLATVVLQHLDNRHLRSTPEFEARLRDLVEQIHRHRDPVTFGNAGDMRDLARRIETAWARRAQPDYDPALHPTDLPAVPEPAR